MPIFDVLAPDGRKVRLEGPEPPSEAELDEIFASLGPVEKLNQTASLDDSAEVQAIMANPEFAAALEAQKRPSVFQEFVRGDNILNPLNHPSMFLRGVGRGLAFAQNKLIDVHEAAQPYVEPLHRKLQGVLKDAPFPFGLLYDNRYEPVFGKTEEKLPYARVTEDTPALNFRLPRPTFAYQEREPSGFTRAVEEELSALTSPVNVGLAGAPGSAAIRALFLSQMVPAAYEGIKGTFAPGLTFDERVEAGVRAAVPTAMAIALGTHKGPSQRVGLRPDEFESSFAALTLGEKADIRGRTAFREQPVIIGEGERPLGPVPSFYEVPRARAIVPETQVKGQEQMLAGTGLRVPERYAPAFGEAGQVSFAGEAAAEAVPSARQTGVPERPLRNVSEQERLMRGTFVPGTKEGRLFSGVPMFDPSDVARYKELVEKVKNAPLEARFGMTAEIERIKNKYGGMPPVDKSPPETGGAAQGKLERPVWLEATRSWNKGTHVLVSKDMTPTLHGQPLWRATFFERQKSGEMVPVSHDLYGSKEEAIAETKRYQDKFIEVEEPTDYWPISYTPEGKEIGRPGVGKKSPDVFSRYAPGGRSASETFGTDFEAYKEWVGKANDEFALRTELAEWEKEPTSWREQEARRLIEARLNEIGKPRKEGKPWPPPQKYPPLPPEVPAPKTKESTIHPVDEATGRIGTVKEVLERIGSNKKSPYSNLAARLMEIGDEDGMKVEVRRENGRGMWSGVYHTGFDRIGIDPDFLYNDKTYLHESIHAFTHKKLAGAITGTYKMGRMHKEALNRVLQDPNGDPAVKELIKLFFETETRAPETKSEYGMSDFQEFMTEGFSNKAFQQKLAALTTGEGGKSLWERFKEAVAKLLGFKVEDKTVLGELIEHTSSLIQQKRPSQTTADVGDVYTPRERGGVAEGIVPPETKAMSLAGDFLSPDFWKELGFKRGVSVDAKQMGNRVRNLLGKQSVAWEMVKDVLPKKGSLTVEELEKVVKENGPKVEVRKFGVAQDKTTAEREAETELARLRHTIDTRHPNWIDEYNTEIFNTWPKADRDLFNEYDRLERELDMTRDSRLERAATTHWSSIAPKSEKDMPGYTEIAVVKPNKITQDMWDEKTPTPKDKFPSSHSFPPNTLVFARFYTETLPSGKKAINVVEVQRDLIDQDTNTKEYYIVGQPKLGRFKNYNDAASALQNFEPLANKDYNRLALKAVIEHARKEGIDSVILPDAETVMLTEGHDKALVTYIDPTEHNIQIARKYNTPLSREVLASLEKGKPFEAGSLDPFERSEKHMRAIDAERAGFNVRQAPAQEPGMRLNYDTILPRIMEELTGAKGERVSVGEHEKAFQDQQEFGTGDRASALALARERGLPDSAVIQQGNGYWGLRANVPRQNLIFRNPDGTPKTDVSGLLYPIKGAREELSVTGKDRARVAEGITQKGTELHAGVPLPTKDELKNVGRQLAKPVQLYSEPIVERLGRIGGPVSKKVSEEGRGIVSAAKLVYGEMTPEVDAAKKELGGATPFAPERYGMTTGLTTEGIEPTTWIRDINKVTEGSAYNNFYGVNEGAVTAPKEASRIIRVSDIANKKIGDVATRANPDFVPSNKLQRILSNFGYDVIRRGFSEVGDAWDNWTQGIAKVNNMPLADVVKFFNRWKAELDEAGTDAAALDKISQDFVRKFPRTITHVKSQRAWHEVLVADPFEYFEAAAQRTAHAVAFRQVYPLIRNPNTGKLQSSGLLEATRKAVLKEIPTDTGKKEFDNLIRALQGHPLDVFTGGWSAPDTLVGGGYRMMRQLAIRPIKAAMLSLNAPVNLSEAITGGPSIFLGMRNTAKGMLKLAKEPSFYGQLETGGQVNRALYNMAGDPTSPLRAASRKLANATSRATLQQGLNELQETQAAVTARMMTDRIRGIGVPLSPEEIGRVDATARAMGMTKAEAERMLGGDEKLLKQFETKAASWLTAGNQAMAEMSRAGASRVFNELFWFHRYSQMVANQFRSVGGNMVENVGAWRQAKKAGNTVLAKKEWDRAYNDAKLMGRMIGGRTLQGAATIGVVAAVTGGLYGVAEKWQEAKDEPLDFLADSFLQGAGGPLAILRRTIQGTHEQASLEQQLVALSPPFGAAGDFYDAAFDIGRYEGRTTLEKVKMFLETKAPGWKAIRLGMAIANLSGEDHELEVATRAFYRWRRSQPGYPKGTEEEVDLRTQVKRVKEKMLKGEDWQSELKKVSDMEYAAGSLRAGTLLEVGGKPLTIDQLKELEQHIGKSSVEKLRLRDAAVRELGRQIGEADKKGEDVVSKIKPPTGVLAKDYTTETRRREEVQTKLKPQTVEWLKMSKTDVPSFETDIVPGRRARELTKDETDLYAQVFAEQLELRLQTLVGNKEFEAKSLAYRKARISDKIELARTRTGSIVRAKLRQPTKPGVGAQLQGR